MAHILFMTFSGQQEINNNFLCNLAAKNIGFQSLPIMFNGMLMSVLSVYKCIYVQYGWKHIL